MGRLLECLPTELAFIWPLAGVDSLMTVEIVRRLEEFVANFAFVLPLRLLAVNSSMNGNVR